jgi:carbon-monoxide dehydrogenase medium subunit
VCNASPAADTVAPLLVADAHLTLLSQRGDRRLPLDEFLIDRRRTALRPDELLASIDLDPLPPGSAEAYIKLGRRGAMDVAIVGIATRLGFAEDGTVETARVAICSVAPTPRRVPDAEVVLVGSKLDRDSLDAAGEAMRAAASPISDARGSASYRIRTLRGLLERVTTRCAEAARG